MADERDHYETIGVRRNATSDQIRRAYVKQAREIHPDRFASASADEQRTAERKMRELNEAWSVLRDAAGRKRYDDLMGFEALPLSSAPKPPRQAGPGSNPPPNTMARDHDRPSGAVSSEPRDPNAHKSFGSGFLMPLVLGTFIVLLVIAAIGAATAADDDAGSLSESSLDLVGKCVVFQPALGFSEVSCGADNQFVVSLVLSPTDCGSNTTAEKVPNKSEWLCLLDN